MSNWRAGRNRRASALLALAGTAAASAPANASAPADASALADASLCHPSSDHELVQVAHTVTAPARSRTTPGYRVGVVQTRFLARTWSRDGHSLAIAHDYRAHRIGAGGGEAQTNGHLHRLSPRYRFTGTRWDVGFGPVVATSSNVGRHPGEIHRSLIDWHGSVAYRVRLATHLTGYAGVCRDDRFGRVRVSPLLGVTWDPGHAVRGTMGWPDSMFEWDVHPRWRIRADVNPVGGHWTVYDNDLARRSSFQYAGWRVRLGLEFRAAVAHRVAVSVGRDVRRSFRFRLEDGRAFSSDFDDATAVGVEWRWLRRAVQRHRLP